MTGVLLAMVVSGCQYAEIPVMHLSIEDTIGIASPVPVKMTYTSGKRHWQSSGYIQRRGGMSIKYEKHSYKIELNKNTDLEELPANDDWIIHASAIDKTFMRNVISYEWFREMSDVNIAPVCNYMQLYLNDNYKGLYILMEQLESTRLGINKNDSTACIFKDPPVFRIDTITPQHSGNYYQQTYPDGGNAYGLQTLDSIRDILLRENESDFYNWSKTTFDWNNIADWHILLLLTNNGDGVVKNFYLYKQDAHTPFRIAPWDYDHSFGRDGDNEYNMLATLAEPERNILLKRLMELAEYRRLLGKRWQEMRASGIISTEHFNQLLNEHSTLIEEAIPGNSALWPNDSWWYYDSNSFQQEIDIMRQYMELRLPQLDSYLESI